MRQSRGHIILCAILLVMAFANSSSLFAETVCQKIYLTQQDSILSFNNLSVQQKEDFLRESENISDSSNSQESKFLKPLDIDYLNMINQSDKKTAFSQIYVNKDGHIEGFLFARFDNRSGAKGRVHIDKIAVAPSLRNQGIGTRLLHTLAARALELGRNDIELYVATNNLKATQLYQHLGFVDVSASEPPKTHLPALRLVTTAQGLVATTGAP